MFLVVVHVNTKEVAGLFRESLLRATIDFNTGMNGSAFQIEQSAEYCSRVIVFAVVVLILIQERRGWVFFVVFGISSEILKILFVKFFVIFFFLAVIQKA